MLQRDNPIEAYRFLQSELALDSEIASITSDEDVVADADLLSGDLEGAKSIVAQVIRGSNGGTSRDVQDWYVRLSYIASSQGVVYDGQREYCLNRLAQICKDQNLNPALKRSIRESNSAASVRLLSCLTLGFQNSNSNTDYLELALRLDPSNQAAARQLIRLYGYRGRYGDIRRVASTIKGHLTPGPDRDEFEVEADKVRGLADKPQHYLDDPDPKVIHP